MEKELLRLSFSEICRGCSVEKSAGTPYYIKHLTHHDQISIDIFHEDKVNEAVKRGIPKEKEKLEWLEKNDIWTRKQENDIINTRAYIKNLENTKRIFPIRSQLEAHKKLIEEEKVKLYKTESEREALIGLTCEKHADRRLNDYYIGISMFTDAALTKPIFEIEKLGDLYDEDINHYGSIYFGVMERLKMQTIKRIAIADFFQSYFGICGEDLYNFFGKSICDLTFCQLNLISYGRYFRQIMSQMENIRDDIRNDPDKLEEYFNLNERAKQQLDKQSSEGGMTSLVGGNSSDYKEIGEKTINDQFREAAKAGGGTLKTTDLMKILKK